MASDPAYRLYQAAIGRYQGARFPGCRRAFEEAVRLAALWQMRRQGMRFPERSSGGWWWTWRWRLEVLMRWAEHESVELCRRLIGTGMTAVDIGAHVGYYTRLFAELVGPSGRVFAFEPCPENYAILRHNLAARRYQNVETSRLAVSDRRGKAALHLSRGSSNHSLLAGYTDPAGSVEVETVTLDSFLGQRGVERVDFVKVDVEGAEPQVLAGMTSTIERSPRLSMLVECNPAALACGGSSADDLIESLRRLRFAVEPIAPAGRTDSAASVNLLCRPA